MTIPLEHFIPRMKVILAFLFRLSGLWGSGTRSTLNWHHQSGAYGNTAPLHNFCQVNNRV
jgi:hypothetical protein